jgi:hypothetical protein
VARSKRTGFLGRKKIRLADDDADMMLVFMLIAHLRFSEVPRKLGFHQLLGMARICNRYNVNEVVDPLVPEWMAAHKSRLLETGYEAWLYIAYQFGMEVQYLRLANYLAANCRINAAKQLLIPGTSHILTGHFPERCLGKSLLVDV